MKLPRRSFGALVAVCLVLIGISCVSAVEPPVRIMPLGDSITWGVADSNEFLQGGYRDRLYSLLTTAGYNVDFIGTQTDTNNPELPDKNHQGMSGWRVDEANTYVESWLNAIEDPDVVLILIGTNDFIQHAMGSRTETPAGVLAELDVLISKIATKRPFAKIIVSNLLVSGWVSNGIVVENLQQQFNAGIPGLVSQHVALGHQVTMIDMHSVLTLSDLFDGVHPDTDGYDEMADAWLPKIQSVIAQKGTTNPPVIARINDPEDSTHVSVTFSKPVSDASANVSNFSLSGGITISNAVLDSATKRIITLTTSPQTAGASYTLTVSGVRDRTTAQTLIAPQSMAIVQPSIVNNSSFESQYSGWTHTGNQEIKDENIDPNYEATDGTKLVAFNTGDANPNGVLSQSFTTISGKTYKLAFDLGTAGTRTSSWTQQLNVSVQGSGNLLNTTSTLSSSYSGINNWFPWEYQFTANSSTTTLTFTDTSPQNKSFSIDLVLDNVRVIGQLATTLAVTSTPSIGTNITISPNDLSGSGSGPTGLIRSYNDGTSVTVTAPATSGGRNFLNWQINGANLPSSNRTINVTLDENTSLNAVYDPSVTTAAPVAVADSYSTNEDTALVVSAAGVLANDTDSNPLPITAVLNSGPSHGNLTLDPNGGFTYTPALNYNGADSFTYHANNGELNSNVVTVSITVNSVNDPPVAVDDGSVGSPFLTVNEDSGQSSSMFVLTNDSDVDGGTLTITQANSPNGSVSIVSTNTRLRFTPTANFSGATTISYTISDGQGGTDTATVHVYVTPFNDPPLAVNDGSVGSPFLTVNEDSGASSQIAVLANDSDVDLDTLTVTQATSPNGTVAINLNGTLTFTPATNFNGATTISYTISDGEGGTGSATVHVFVTPVNDPPVALAQSISLNEDASLAITLAGTDVENSSLTFAKGSPSHGTLSGTAPNLTYNPAANYNGTDSFSFTVNDGSLTSAPATVSITVNPVNDPPVAMDDGSVVTPFLAVNEDSGASSSMFVLNNDSDVDGDSLTITGASSPNGSVSIVSSNTRLTFMPAAHFNGATTISYTISDGNGGTDSATVHVFTTPVNDPPVAADDGSVGTPFLTVDEDSGASAQIAVLANDSDIDLDPLTVTEATSANGAVIINGNGSLTFTPTANFNGATTISYTISDGQGGTDAAIAYVFVTPVNDPPVAVDNGYETDEDTELVVPAPGVLANDTDTESAPLSAVLVTDAQHGDLTLASDGSFSYTPDNNFHGVDTFTYKASDGSLNSNIVTVTITINEVGGSPLTEWLAEHGLAAVPGGDSDQDSICNAVEYVIGGNPNGQMDANLLPTATMVVADPDDDTISSEYLLFTYRRTDRAKNDGLTTIAVEWSADPAGPWTTADGTHDEVILAENDQAGPETDWVHVYIPLAPEGKLFARLKVIVLEE